MNDRFPVEAERILRSVGWAPGRAVEVESALVAWRSLGLDAETGPVSFVHEFDGLFIRHPPFVDVDDVRYFDYARFDVARAVRGMWPRAYLEYTNLAGADLYPVGENRSHMTLMAGRDARLFAGVDNWLFVYAGGLESSVVAICQGVSPALVGEWSL
ncbi:SUKH-3 domain-containing protein [Actinomadura terrae]|uniref:SUKH-3 domain-containing protein n=1 Tax=Actinomadura terrae TaxID=604353 RepID=UPI001FA75B07|nr:SUKH-3 domain-containing protein [Actinomadura terrae]